MNNRKSRFNKDTMHHSFKIIMCSVVRLGNTRNQDVFVLKTSAISTKRAFITVMILMHQTNQETTQKLRAVIRLSRIIVSCCERQVTRESTRWQLQTPTPTYVKRRFPISGNHSIQHLYLSCTREKNVIRYSRRKIQQRNEKQFHCQLPVLHYANQHWLYNTSTNPSQT